MKKHQLLILILFISISFNGHTQDRRSQKEKEKISSIFFDFGIGYATTGFEGTFGGNFILSNDWGASCSYSLTTEKARAFPNYYYSSLLSLDSPTPFDHMYFFNINIIKRFPIIEDQFKIGVEIGPSIISYEFAEFTRKSSGSFNIDPNYYVTYPNKNALGLSLRTTAYIATAKYIGFAIAMYGNFNTIRPVYGAELCVNIGLME